MFLSSRLNEVFHSEAERVSLKSLRFLAAKILFFVIFVMP